MSIANKKNISIVGTVGIPAKYGGFETLAEQLTNQLSKSYNITVFCSAKSYKKNEREIYNNISRIFIPFKANGFQSLIYDTLSLYKAIKISDTICLFGASASIFLPLFSPFLKKKTLIFHPDGKEWKRKKWNSFSSLYLYLSTKVGCKSANYIIIDNKALLPFYKSFENKLVECSYGGDQYNLSNLNSPSKTYWLTIARAEPENNLQLIAEAFKQSPSQKWFLISNYQKTKFGRHLYHTYGKQSNITFIPMVYSKTVIEKYLSECKGYIHGHSAGGTNPSLTAAMWLNKPLLCHNNVFNMNTTKKKAIFFSSSQELSSLIKTNNSIISPLTLEALKIAKEEYTWKKVANVYETLFKSRS